MAARRPRRRRDGGRQDRHLPRGTLPADPPPPWQAKAIVATARAVLEIAYLLISNQHLRYHDLGPGYYDRIDPPRQTRNKIRELERLNPGMKVTLTAAAA